MITQDLLGLYSGVYVLMDSLPAVTVGHDNLQFGRALLVDSLSSLAYLTRFGYAEQLLNSRLY